MNKYNNNLYFLSIFIFSSGSRGNRVPSTPPPSNTENLQRMRNSPRQPEMRIDSRKNFKFTLNFSKFFIKIFLKSLNLFEKLLKFSIKFPKCFQTLTIFLKSQSLTYLQYSTRILKLL